MHVREDAPWRDRPSAERMADTIREAVAKAGGVATVAARMALKERDYIAIRLSDGGWDRTLYHSRTAALRHQTGNRNQYFYLPVPPVTWSARTCDSLLFYWRRIYEGGYRPDGTHEGIVIARQPNSIEVLRG